MMQNFFNVAMLALEAQQVVFLRTMKLANGGAPAAQEAMRMVSEKVFASQEAALDLMNGVSPDRVLMGVRRKVRANARRLSAKPARLSRKKP